MPDSNLQISSAPNVAATSRREVAEVFARYEFKDALGHELIHCQDFIDLVEAASSASAINDAKNCSTESFDRIVFKKNQLIHVGGLPFRLESDTAMLGCKANLELLDEQAITNHSA